MNKEQNKILFQSKIASILESENVQYKFVQKSDFNYSEIQMAMISNYASWSGYTFAISNTVIKRLSNLLSDKKLTHYILDCDFVTNEIQIELFNTASWGYFESCWVENGKVVSQYKYKAELEPFIVDIERKLKNIQK